MYPTPEAGEHQDKPGQDQLLAFAGLDYANRAAVQGLETQRARYPNQAEGEHLDKPGQDQLPAFAEPDYAILEAAQAASQALFLASLDRLG